MEDDSDAAQGIADGMTPKAHRAQETRWRFLSIRTKANEYHNAEFANRTKARAFAEWLHATGIPRSIELTDRNHAGSGYGWANPD